MQCLKPLKLDNKEGGGITVPCGRCAACRINRTREWSIRLMHESSYWQKACFLTLTYDDDHLSWDNDLEPEKLQKYFKRLRKNEARYLRYYAAGEYGEKYGRPHYHVALFGYANSLEDNEILQKNWPEGNIFNGTLTYQSARYIAQYIQKKIYGLKGREEYGWRQPPFSLMSKGLGERYALEYQDVIMERGYVTKNGKNAGLPRYYRKKLDMDNSYLAEKFKDWEEERRLSIRAHTSEQYKERLSAELVKHIDDNSFEPVIKEYYKPTKSKFLMDEADQREKNILASWKKDKF